MENSQRFRCLNCRRELRADEQPCPHCGHNGREIIMIVNENINIDEENKDLARDNNFTIIFKK